MSNAASQKLAEHYHNMVDWVNWQIEDLTDEEMRQSIAPGTNHGIWLLGHLIVSDDDLGIYLGKGDRLFPELFATFGQSSQCLAPEKYPTLPELKEMWKKVSERNHEMLLELSDEDLYQPHARFQDNERDFFKTKFRVISFWILHQQYHAGQLGLLNAVTMRKRTSNNTIGLA